MAEVAALIPARAGSRGIVGKNLRRLGGKPLIAWTIEAAKLAELERVYVSTESSEIAKVASDHGVFVIPRPYELAEDKTPMKAVIQHALQEIKPLPDILALLQPTAPFRTPARVQECIARLQQSDADCVMTVQEIPAHFAPEWAWKIVKGEAERYLRHILPPTRRQDLQPSYARDGGCYAFRVESFLHTGDLYGTKTLAVVVPDDEACNLDEEKDWREAELRVERGRWPSMSATWDGQRESARESLRVLERIEGVF